MDHMTRYIARNRRSLSPDRGRGFAGGGRARRGKLFDSGQFQLLLLALIGDGERHGYELMRTIEERTGGVYVPSPGVVYPTLTLLQDMDLVRETEPGGARKSFAVTEAGQQLLTERAEQVQMLTTRLDALGSKAARADSAPIRRAMGNLKQVLMDRLSKSGTTDENILEAARIIDDVAGRIERM